nr:MAG TPA: hypothetical protein [Caudoviricetes sp.]
MSHSRSMSSADCTPQPQSTQAGASRREANTLAACSMGLSPGSGSRHTRSYRPTWPRMMCPSSCAQVKRCRAGIAMLDTMIVGAPPMTVDMPSLLSRSAGVYRRTDTPSARHTPLILTGSSVTLQSIRMRHDASRASL